MDPHSQPPPAAAILQLITNVWAAQAAAAFARLGIADLLADGPRSAGHVAERTGANPDATYRLLRGVTAVGIVRALPDRTFALTPVGECLRSGVPTSMRSLLIAETARGHWLPWGEVEHSVRTGEPATHKTLGMSAWDYYQANPEEAFHFAEGMGNVSAMAGEAVLGAYGFDGARLVVDVGGSHGSMVAAVLKRQPSARGILFDLPHVVEEAGPMLAAAGVADRVERRGGDFRREVPAGGDTYVLKAILHDWSDDECVAILANCRRAMAPGGRVVVVEMLIDDAGPPSPAPLMDLNMLVMLTGRERTAEEFGNLFRRAGLKLERVVPTHSPFVVIEATAP